MVFDAFNNLFNFRHNVSFVCAVLSCTNCIVTQIVWMLACAFNLVYDDVLLRCVYYK